MSAERHGAQISPGGQQFRGDDGSADPAVIAALESWRDGEGSEHAALSALSTSRLLVPVVAILGEADESGADKSSEMALPKLVGQDGRQAIVAFTSVAAVSRWRPDARPVPAEAIRVWQAAVAEECAVVIDVAGPVPLAVEGARLAAMAKGEPPPLPYQDPDILAAVRAAIAETPAITSVRIEPAAPQHQNTKPDPAKPDPDLAVRLTIDARMATSPSLSADLGEAANRIAARLAGRVRAVEITTE